MSFMTASVALFQEAAAAVHKTLRLLGPLFLPLSFSPFLFRALSLSLSLFHAFARSFTLAFLLYHSYNLFLLKRSLFLHLFLALSLPPEAEKLFSILNLSLHLSPLPCLPSNRPPPRSLSL